MAEQSVNKNDNGAGKKLFREKSLEKFSNPENLNDYLRVTSPGVWPLLGTVIVLLAGVCIWAFLGRIQSTARAAVVTEDGVSLCMVPKAALEGVMDNHVVLIGKENLELSSFVQEPVTISESTDAVLMMAGDYAEGDVVYPVPLAEALENDGIESAEVVTEIISPAALFFDR